MQTKSASTGSRERTESLLEETMSARRWVSDSKSTTSVFVRTSTLGSLPHLTDQVLRHRCLEGAAADQQGHVSGVPRKARTASWPSVSATPLLESRSPGLSPAPTWSVGYAIRSC